ncbi:hypothetical protein AAMO2058_000302900 [Amorphochlora amoebiformis]
MAASEPVRYPFQRPPPPPPPYRRGDKPGSSPPPPPPPRRPKQPIKRPPPIVTKVQERQKVQFKHLRSPTAIEFQSLMKGAQEKKSSGKTMTVNALGLLRQWTTFKKYGKRGSPAFRDVRLSPDNLYIEYISRKKSPEESKIAISQISQIELGWKSKNFNRFAPKPSLSKACFTITYDEGTLDLVAQNKADYLLWTEGLMKVRKLFKQQPLLSFTRVQHVDLEIPTSATYVSYVQYWEADR